MIDLWGTFWDDPQKNTWRSLSLVGITAKVLIVQKFKYCACLAENAFLRPRNVFGGEFDPKIRCNIHASPKRRILARKRVIMTYRSSKSDWCSLRVRRRTRQNRYTQKPKHEHVTFSPRPPTLSLAAPPSFAFVVLPDLVYASSIDIRSGVSQPRVVDNRPSWSFWL